MAEGGVDEHTIHTPVTFISLSIITVTMGMDILRSGDVLFQVELALESGVYEYYMYVPGTKTTVSFAVAY